jgi:pimeloyl-ACP methyl ester carboxylesterase
MHRAFRLAVVSLVGIALGSLCMSILVAEGALHIWQRPAALSSPAEALGRQTGALWEDVKVIAGDGELLDAWLFTPRQPNGAAVMALHGVGDTRLGMLSDADFLVRAGYTVLAPDCRGHGASGGDLMGLAVAWPVVQMGFLYTCLR